MAAEKRNPRIDHAASLLGNQLGQVKDAVQPALITPRDRRVG